MPISLHQASVPLFQQMLESLSAVLSKAEAHCTAAGTKPADMLSMRLAPDMFTLTQQVQRACTHACGAAARLAGLPVPEEGDKEASFKDLQNRIGRARAFLSTVRPEQIAAHENDVIEQPTRVKNFSFPAPDLLLHFAIPQFMFHVTTAYNIIRHAGVTIGKVDYMGNIMRR